MKRGSNKSYRGFIINITPVDTYTKHVRVYKSNSAMVLDDFVDTGATTIPNLVRMMKSRIDAYCEKDTEMV